MLYQYTDKIHHTLFVTFSLSRVTSDLKQKILLKNTYLCARTNTHTHTRTLSHRQVQKNVNSTKVQVN